MRHWTEVPRRQRRLAINKENIPMREDGIKRFVSERFQARLAARPDPHFASWRAVSVAGGALGATLGYRGATEDRLFLEAYLDAPIEAVASRALQREIGRARIVEIGCLAAISPLALVRLWAETAVEFADRYDVAVATLSASLRRLITRAGVPIVELAPADPTRIAEPERWGSYYDDAPMVCAGWTHSGAAGLGRFRTRTERAA
ncbi:thermostable hemolysin [Sphingomonas oligophenolica]|uniref:Thermostable hemolysin n=1 Tax=Sphingomonas oligophenolica TaxID=301154 RepID=A0ABU9Y6S4_9SPHN